MQRLYLPLKNTRLTASIKTAHYKKVHGFEHYGSDFVSGDNYYNRDIMASGIGVVRDFGYDNNCGNILIIEYKNCFNHRENKVYNLVFRYFHLEKIYVKKYKQVDSTTVLGRYGRTGRYGGTGPHLHLEADTDLKYIFHTPTLASGRYLLKGRLQGANDSTVFNPLDFLHLGNFQTYTTNPNKNYIKDEDLILKKI